MVIAQGFWWRLGISSSNLSAFSHASSRYCWNRWKVGFLFLQPPCPRTERCFPGCGLWDPIPELRLTSMKFPASSVPDLGFSVSYPCLHHWIASFCLSWKLLITGTLLEWALPWTLNHFASDLKPSNWGTEFWQLTGPFDETVGTVGFWDYLLLSSLLNVRPFQLTLAAIITHRRVALAFASGLAPST